ncbi:uncharacterized protein KGF55_003318 [Candida pseudojiufengensis]|uniref:uncharacterized protein n=1 Tax=Candida pseudojiufengensis TaxID=497109 RepID=UPI002224D2D6|nr:uncharacterized protein KGF55_003318 [Candida pseudojiufengensis]KAI5962242.1 hypothetical protein KGF55_003318 [Candida pseudojiufengensis]
MPRLKSILKKSNSFSFKSSKDSTFKKVRFSDYVSTYHIPRMNKSKPITHKKHKYRKLKYLRYTKYNNDTNETSGNTETFNIFNSLIPESIFNSFNCQSFNVRLFNFHSSNSDSFNFYGSGYTKMGNTKFTYEVLSSEPSNKGFYWIRKEVSKSLC